MKLWRGGMRGGQRLHESEQHGERTKLQVERAGSQRRGPRTRFRAAPIRRERARQVEAAVAGRPAEPSEQRRGGRGVRRRRGVLGMLAGEGPRGPSRGQVQWTAGGGSRDTLRDLTWGRGDRHATGNGGTRSKGGDIFGREGLTHGCKCLFKS